MNRFLEEQEWYLFLDETKNDGMEIIIVKPWGISTGDRGREVKQMRQTEPCWVRKRYRNSPDNSKTNEANVDQN